MTSTGTDLERLQDEIADLERRLKDAKSRLTTAPLASLSATPLNNVGLSPSVTSYRQSH